MYLQAENVKKQNLSVESEEFGTLLAEWSLYEFMIGYIFYFILCYWRLCDYSIHNFVEKYILLEINKQDSS